MGSTKTSFDFLSDRLFRAAPAKLNFFNWRLQASLPKRLDQKAHIPMEAQDHFLAAQFD
jgi:hypothetical protein